MKDYVYNVAQVFERCASENAERAAILFSEDSFVTYKQLHRLVNQTARFLLDRGVRSGDRICLCTDKSIVPYVVMLASLRIGAIYFAIDPKNPADRLRRIIDQCDPVLIFADSDSGLSPWQTRVVRCEDWREDFPVADAYDDAEIDGHWVDGNQAAYIMFTSGSTGLPKGAVITHGNLVHFAGWARSQYALTPDDRHTHLNPLYFDNTVFDVYSTLLSGGCLVPFSTTVMQTPAAIVKRIRETRCNVFFSVPSLLMYLDVLKQITAEDFRSVRAMIFGGEGYPKVKLQKVFSLLKENTRFFNVYGPTECTCICSNYEVTEQDFDDLEGLPPLGRMIPNFRPHVLCDDEPADPGQVGELCLGGPCVGSGYFNQTEQTKAAFVQNPLNAAFRDILYRTGDLVRLDPDDGLMYFVGRKDFQIKRQGYRIELEEIQSALVSLDGVDEATVLFQSDSDPSKIIAVVATGKALNPRDIAASLKDLTPDYMLPDEIRFVDRMPKNANGKTDRRALETRFFA